MSEFTEVDKNMLSSMLIKLRDSKRMFNMLEKNALDIVGIIEEYGCNWNDNDVYNETWEIHEFFENYELQETQRKINDYIEILSKMYINKTGE